MFHTPPTLALLGVHAPPSVALVCAIGLVIFLFRRDSRQRPDVTGAVWIPLLWVLLIGSRSVVQWLHTLHFPIGLGSAEEGNPLDALVYFTLIASGLYVLNQRRVDLAAVIRTNGWVMAFLVFCFVAIFWSDFPFAAFKHWIKVLGHPIMALVLFTEPDPDEAIARLMKRSAYVLVIFSILTIKYYPDIGRQFDDWTGLPTNSGVAQNKNALGSICLVLGFFFVWYFLKIWLEEKSRWRRNELRLIGGVLIGIGWLLRNSHAATATLCLLLATALIIALQRDWVDKRRIGTYVVLALLALVASEFAFGSFRSLIELTGHESTFMGRVELWRECLALHTNPIFGVGFESFWIGDRLELLHQGRPWQPNEAHNGYLETYLNMGFLGLFMLGALIVATFGKIRQELFRNPNWGRYRFGFLAALLFYNLTEATFRGLSLTWFVFFLVAMDYPYTEYEPLPKSLEREELDETAELTYLPE